MTRLDRRSKSPMPEAIPLHLAHALKFECDIIGCNAQAQSVTHIHRVDDCWGPHGAADILLMCRRCEDEVSAGIGRHIANRIAATPVHESVECATCSRLIYRLSDVFESEQI